MEWVLANTVGLLVGVIVGAILRGRADVPRIERKLDVLLRHSGVDLARVAAEEALLLYKAGKKIEAIKAYRDLTGSGLAEAKAKVESLA